MKHPRLWGAHFNVYRPCQCLLHAWTADLGLYLVVPQGTSVSLRDTVAR
jgi:hypothetical protein